MPSAAAWLLVLSCPIASGDEAAKARFLKEYAAGEKKLAAAYSHVVISATATEQRTPKEPATVSIVDYRSSGPKLRIETDASGINERGPFRRRMVRVCNPEKESFTADWNDFADGFVLRATDPDHQGVAETIRLDCPFARPAYGFFEVTVRELLDFEGVAVERFERIDVKGKSLAKLTTSQKMGDGRVISSYRTFTFDPSRHWALVEFTFGLTPDRQAATTCQIEYSTSAKGVPLVKSMRRWHVAKDGTRDQQLTVEVHSIEVKDVPDADFTLGAFGIAAPPK
jgi:hypothetical protein